MHIYDWIWPLMLKFYPPGATEICFKSVSNLFIYYYKYTQLDLMVSICSLIRDIVILTQKNVGL